jgi:hypothetical protein
VCANLGGGGGSSDMIARWLEAGHHLDCVDFVNPGFERGETLERVENVMRPWLAERGVPLHVLKPSVLIPNTREVGPNGKPVAGSGIRVDSILVYHKDHGQAHGAFYPRPLRSRSCSERFKHEPMVAHRRELYGETPRVILIGIDASEPGRIGDGDAAANERHLFPLVDPWNLRPDALRASCIARWGYAPPKSACEFCSLGKRAHFVELLRRDRATYLLIEALEEQDPSFPEWTVLAHGPPLRELREAIEGNQSLDRFAPEPDGEVGACMTAGACRT